MAFENAEPAENLFKNILIQAHGTSDYYKHNYADSLVVPNGLKHYPPHPAPMHPPHETFKKEMGFPFSSRLQ